MHAMATGGPGFAVVDVETTGLSPHRDRIVEVAVVHVDTKGSVSGEFTTLVNPQRDVGPTHIHGLRASDLVDAPSFESAAPSVWNWLAGRVLVAHNVSFDLRFLDAELTRSGLRLPPPPTLCTMKLSSSYLASLPARTLVACCAAAHVTLPNHHSALDDARAAAELLSRFRSSHRTLPTSWDEALREANGWGPPVDVDGFKPVTRRSVSQRRQEERPELAKLVDRLPRIGHGELESYEAVLDRVIEDRLITATEASELAEVADSLGVSVQDALEAHRHYLEEVCALALEDGVVTSAERADLLEVGRLLGIPPEAVLTMLEEVRACTPPRLAQASRSPLRRGDRVVFTGEMEHSREDLVAQADAAGLQVTGSVSKKTALVVAADPESRSGKARRARELGVRMVTEQVFLYLLGDVG